MSKVVVSEFLSLDGIMEAPAWTAPYRNDEIAQFKYDELFAFDALLALVPQFFDAPVPQAD